MGKDRDELWRNFVLAADIEVSEERLEQEMYLIEQDLRHRMHYEQLSGGEPHLLPQLELAAQQDEIREAALYEIKEPQVVKQIVAEQKLVATKEELEAAAAAMAERQNTTVEAIKSFFGEELAALERDVLLQKAIDWVAAQA